MAENRCEVGGLKKIDVAACMRKVSGTPAQHMQLSAISPELNPCVRNALYASVIPFGVSCSTAHPFASESTPLISHLDAHHK